MSTKPVTLDDLVDDSPAEKPKRRKRKPSEVKSAKPKRRTTKPDPGEGRTMKRKSGRKVTPKKATPKKATKPAAEKSRKPATKKAAPKPKAPKKTVSRSGTKGKGSRPGWKEYSPEELAEVERKRLRTMKKRGTKRGRRPGVPLDLGDKTGVRHIAAELKVPEYKVRAALREAEFEPGPSGAYSFNKTEAKKATAAVKRMLKSTRAYTRSAKPKTNTKRTTKTNTKAPAKRTAKKTSAKKAPARKRRATKKAS